MKKSAALFMLIAAALILRPVLAASLDNSGTVNAQTALAGTPVGRHTLFDQTGKRFDFPPSDAQGKAIVVNFIYTDCGHVCPLIVERLADAYRKAGGDFGGKFIAMTIGLDTERDTPEHLAGFAKRFVKDPVKWRFASSDEKTVAAMTKEFGVYYKKTKDGFEHANTVTIIGPDYRIFSQVYGQSPLPDEILKPVYASLKPSGAFGASDAAPRPISLLDRLRVLCYTYDPVTGAYRADFGFIVVAGLGLFVWGAGIFFVRHLIRGARQADKSKARADE